MKVLVIGGTGMLGSDLVELAPPAFTVVAPPRRVLDITDEITIARALDEFRPDWVVNASAYTAVDNAERETALAFAVNCDAVGALGRACATRRIRLAHFSTDYVFSGSSSRPYREADAVGPINAYGQSKLAGERSLHDSGALALVVRTQWLFGRRGKSFPRTMLERARQRQPTRVVDDQFGCPTYTVDLVRATWDLIARDVSGTYHVTNRGIASWFEVASPIFESAGALSLLSRCSTAEYPTPAKRPSFSVLDTSKLEREIGIVLPPWPDALSRFLCSLESPDDHARG